jgi:hypothetical protein
MTTNPHDGELTMDDRDRDRLIEALEQMDLPPMPRKVQTLIDASPPYLVELLRALADDMEQPGKGAAKLATLPAEARIIEQALRDNPMLCHTGLLLLSKNARLEKAMLQRKMVADNHLH